MKRVFNFVLFVFVCITPFYPQQAKAQGYIKLAKNIFYVGEVVEKRPQGRGMIIVKKDMNTIVFTITGTFQGNEITGNNISVPGISIEDWAEEVETLTFSKIIYSIDNKTDLSLELINTTYSIKLSYSFDKQRKKWKQDVLYCPNNVVDTYYREATTSIPAYKEEIEFTMRTIDLSFDLLDGTGLIKDCGNRKRLYDNGIVVEMDKSQQHFRTTSSMGTVEGSLYSGGYKIDKFSIKAKDGSSWSVTMTESTIHFTDGSQYEGIVATEDSFKYGVFAFNLLQLDKISVKFIDGKLTKSNGNVVTYKNGKSDKENLFNKNFKAFPVSLSSDLTPEVSLNHRDDEGYTTVHNSKKLQALFNNDAAGYFNLKNIETELQKKAFNQSEEYTSTYQPRMQQEKKYLLEDEYYVCFPVKSKDNIHYFEYNINRGKFEFEAWDTEYKEINKGETDFHFLFHRNLCLSYPRSLIALTHHEDNNGKDLYSQTVQTCKVSESDALKVENNIENCEIVWIFKFEKVKDRYIYGKTTRIYIADKKTGEIYCDLTPSLKASSTNFKSATTIKDKTPKKVYHANGRMEKCAFCNGRGVITTWKAGHQLHPRCVDCNGRGWRLEHYW